MEEKHEVVISGVSGMFPESIGLTQLEQNLNSQKNLITNDDRKWTPGELDVPAATGKIKNYKEFDMMFFGIHRKLLEVMDPHIFQSLKYSFEAICDAGLNPSELSGTNTAVLMSSMTSETEYATVMLGTLGGYGMLGNSRTMQANRISFYFNLMGPSCVLDASWTGGMQALSIAHKLIAGGHVTAAIVGVCSLVFYPEISFHYDRMGRLTPGDKTKSFSDDADGYNRSEGCVVLLLQRREDARRSYGSLLNVLATNGGSRNCGLSDCSPFHYEQLLRQAYAESGVHPSQLAYLELDGCANKVVDAMELNCVDKALCSEREEPLLVGSVKSNIGHMEAASSYASIVKALIALNSGFIPPNLHYSSPNSSVPALKNGKIKVVTERTPLPGEVVGVSTIGLAGSYAHAIIKQFSKAKTRTPTKSVLPPDGLPRIVVMSGRNEEDLKKSLQNVQEMPIDEEFVALTHFVFRRELSKHHVFRGYTILTTDPESEVNVQLYSRAVKRPVWFVFSGMGSQWPGMGTELMKFPVFAESIQKCHKALEPKGVNLIDIITNNDPSTFDSILNSFVGIAAVQIGLVDMLRALGIEPDGIVGHSVGELGCAYADGCFTAEQMILSAHARGRASIETKLIRGKMAAVGLGYDDLKDKIPDTIEIACHNSANSCTLSGPERDMEEFIAELKAKGVFAKLVNVSNIAYHSKHIAPAAPALLSYLEEVIPVPKARSRRWVSSSVPECEWDNELAKYSSAAYHTNNLLSSVLFQEAAQHIPAEAIVIEIAPHGLLQAILRRSHQSCVNVSLTNRAHPNGLEYLLSALGRLYLEGTEMDLHQIFPKVEFPVSRNTAPIHNLITWSDPKILDSEGYFALLKAKATPNTKVIEYTQEEKNCEKFTERKIYGTTIISPAAYVNLVIEMYNGIFLNKSSDALTYFEDLKFLNQLDLNTKPKCVIQIQKATGDFELSSDEKVVVSGKINFVDNGSKKFHDLSEFHLTGTPRILNQTEIYDYMEMMGVEHGKSFKNLKKLTMYENGAVGEVIWTGKWTFFIDALFQMISFCSTSQCNKLHLIRAIKNVIIDSSQYDAEYTVVEVYYNYVLRILSCKGVQFHKIETRINLATNSEKNGEMKYEKPEFVPYINPKIQDMNGVLAVCIQLILENLNPSRITKINFMVFGSRNDFVKRVHTALLQQKMLKVSFLDITQEKELNYSKKDYLSKDCCLILTGCGINDEIKGLFHKLKRAYLLSYGTKCSMQNIDKSVMFQYRNDNGSISLIKKDIDREINYNTIYISNNWKIELKNKETNNRRLTYVIGRNISDSSIHEIVNHYQGAKEFMDFRFIFIDSHCPEFSVDNPFFKQQLEMDLRVNICKQGIWGSLRLLPFQGEKSFIDQPLVQLNELRCKGILIKCLGLNLQDTYQYPSFTKLGLLEYSGFRNEKEDIFGICSITNHGSLYSDPILCWEKPKTWTHEQAVTVPLTYSLAYYTLSILINACPDHTILIHDGLSVISQALINIAMRIGSKVFITYGEEKEKQDLKMMFPEINEKNMFSYENSCYEYYINEMTKGKGIDAVINTLEKKEYVDRSLLCIGIRGSFIQMNTEILSSDNLLGMGYFLKESCLRSVSYDCLVNLTNSKKKLLAEIFKKGLDTGTIKPMRMSVINEPISSKEAYEYLISEKEKQKKLILKMGDKIVKQENEHYLCSADNSYLIVDGGVRGFWLELIPWLILRGAHTIYIVLNSNYSENINHSLHCLRLQYPYVQLHFHQLNKINSMDEAQKILTDINSQHPLSATFILGVERESIQHLDTALRQIAPDSKFVCIGEGENVCLDRHKNRFHALSLSIQTGVQKLSNILPDLDYLICKMNKDSVIYVSDHARFHHSTLREDKTPLHNYYLPDSVTELEILGTELRPKVCFEEVSTSCPRHSVNREISPVFILPGLKPNQMNKLISRLFHPAFKVRYPAQTHNLDTLAYNVVEAMSELDLGVFTIIASGCSGPLALYMANYLEKKKRLVTLILLDAVPQTAQSWAHPLISTNYDQLITDFFDISPKLHQDIHNLTSWDEKLNLLVQTVESKEYDHSLIKTGFMVLRNRLEELTNFSLAAQLYCKTFLIIPNDLHYEEIITLQQYLKQNVEITFTGDLNYQEMLDNPITAEKINTLALFEYKDIGHKELEDKFIGLNVLTDSKFNSQELERV